MLAIIAVFKGRFAILEALGGPRRSGDSFIGVLALVACHGVRGRRERRKEG